MAGPAEAPLDRRRIALHEAGHAVACVVFGTPLEYVSIRPGRTFGGVTVGVPREVPDAPGRATWLDPAIRVDLERRVIASLAGDLAERLDPTAGPRPVDETEVRAALEALGPRVVELIEREQRDDPVLSDAAAAWYLAERLAGDGARHYVEWLRVEANELVLRYAAAIGRVAEALERREVLDGPAVAALVDVRPAA